jgi:hypothetical protein
MTNIELIEYFLLSGDLYSAEILCNDENISYLDLLLLLQKYMED